MVTKGTLCYIFNKDKILLQKKSKGLFGEERWNAPGGKIAQDEDAKKSAVREVFEETGLKVKNLKYHGELIFYFGRVKELADWIVYAFLTNNFSGKLKKNHPEGELKWFSINQIPYKKMWGDDLYWLPLVLKGKKVRGEFWFNKKGTKILAHKVKIL